MKYLIRLLTITQPQNTGASLWESKNNVLIKMHIEVASTQKWSWRVIDKINVYKHLGWNGSRDLAILLCNHGHFTWIYEPNSCDVMRNFIKISPVFVKTTLMLLHVIVRFHCQRKLPLQLLTSSGKRKLQACFICNYWIKLPLHVIVRFCFQRKLSPPVVN